MSGFNTNEKNEKIDGIMDTKQIDNKKFTEIAPIHRNRSESVEQPRISEPIEKKKASWGAKFISAFDDHMADFYQDVLNHVKTLQ